MDPLIGPCPCVQRAVRLCCSVYDARHSAASAHYTMHGTMLRLPVLTMPQRRVVLEKGFAMRGAVLKEAAMMLLGAVLRGAVLKGAMLLPR
eukprot:3054710-Rhodomonas_salina.1